MFKKTYFSHTCIIRSSSSFEIPFLQLSVYKHCYFMGAIYSSMRIDLIKLHQVNSMIELNQMNCISSKFELQISEKYIPYFSQKSKWVNKSNETNAWLTLKIFSYDQKMLHESIRNCIPNRIPARVVIEITGNYQNIWNWLMNIILVSFNQLFLGLPSYTNPCFRLLRPQIKFGYFSAADSCAAAHSPQPRNSLFLASAVGLKPSVFKT